MPSETEIPLDEQGEALAPPPQQDWIESFLAYTDGTPSPEIFRLWSGITAIAAALERRVYITTAQSLLFPNLFTLLVAPPAVGKSIAINPVGEIWRETQKIIVAPDNVTKASLVDALAKADRKILVPGGNPPLIEYHSIACCVSELGVLIPQHDLEFLSTVNHIYDNPSSYREERRTLNRSIDISRPQMNILAGSQPGFLATLLPEEAWSMGFTSRIIMIYAGVSPKISLFDRVSPPKAHKDALVKRMTAMTELIGEALFTRRAKDELTRWYMDGMHPVPEHSKLEHYRGRRILHVIKLSLISAVSRTGGIAIDLEDVTRARDWLLGAEQLMPDIFRQMVGKSDTQTLQELHYWAWQVYAKNKKPIQEALIFHFLSRHAPSEKIPKILEIAERSNILSRTAGTDLYTPRPKHEFGIE